MFVALGRYTADAQQFAAQVGMTLVDGEELLRIIGAGLSRAPLVLPTAAPTSAPPCRPVVGHGAAHGSARPERGS